MRDDRTDPMDYLSSERYGYRYHGGAATAAVRGVHTGRLLDHAQVWRHGAGFGAQPPIVPAHGWRYRGCECAGSRRNLYGSATGASPDDRIARILIEASHPHIAQPESVPAVRSAC